MAESSKRKMLLINMFASVSVFIVHIGINFVLSPFIVKHMGVEANGFIMLANNFVTYATLLTNALNSMSSRFITLEYHKGEIELTNKYYTSLFFGNVILSLILLIPTIILIFKLEYFLDIPSHLVFDVKLAFTFIFLNFFLGTLLPSWGGCYYITNKLYIQSIISIFSNFLRAILLIFLFSAFETKVYYVALVASVLTIISQILNFYFKRKLIPNIIITKGSFSWKCLKQLVSSGIWNSISQLGTILLNGVDVLISNLFLGPVIMGIVSVVKIIPNTISSLSSSISNVFSPSLVISYALNDKKQIVKELKLGMRITSTILTVILAGLIVFGREFFALWQPSLEADFLYKLSILSCLSYMVSNSLQCLYSVFTVVNKVKVNSILIIMSGIVSTLVVFILLRYTDLGAYAIVGVSSCINVIRHFIYTIPYSARLLGLKWTTFYPDVFKSIGIVIFDSIVGFIGFKFISFKSFPTLIIVGFLYAITCLFINSYLLLNKNERKLVLNKIFRNKEKKEI